MNTFNALLANIRQYRIGPFTLFDGVGAYIVVFALSPFLIRRFRRWNIETTLEEWLALTLPLALFVHLLLGLSTPFTRMFLDPGNIIAKIVIIAMVVFGLKGTTRSLMKKIQSDR